MKRISNFINRSEFAKNLALVYSANSVAMILQIAFAPFISRLYSPTDFAGFELFAKILALIVVASSLRLELAIIIPKAESEAQAIIKLSFKVLLIASLLSLLAIPFADLIGEALRNEELPFLLWFLPIGVFLSGSSNILVNIMIRLKAFKELSSNKILAAISNNGFKYLFGLKAATPVGLTGGLMLGTLVPNIAFLRPRAVRHQLVQAWKSRIPVKEILRKYKDFPLINSFHAFFDEAQKAALLFLISFYYSEIILGLFAFTWRYLRVPVQVFGTSLGQVLNERIATNIQQRLSVKPILLKAAALLAVLSIVPFAILFFFGGQIFGFIFGSEWTIAGKYSEVIAPWLFLHFVVAPLSMLPVLVNKQRPFFITTVLGNIAALIAVVLMASQGKSIILVLQVITLINSLLLIAILIWFFRICDQHLKAHER